MNKLLCVLLPVLLFAACASHQLPSRYRASEGSDVYFSGGSGESRESPIIIRGALRQSEGVEAEYYYLGKLLGEKGKAWEVEGQTMFREGKRVYDVLELRLLPSGKKSIYYFDVSKLPWERPEAGPENR
jgi:hypothetical protein